MTYKTHREFSVWFALIINILLYEMKLIHTNYYLSMMVVVLFSKQGALFPDVDHNWQNVKEKTMLNRVINYLIHLTGGKHRSWQTHSFDIWLVSLLGFLYLANRLSFEDRAVALLVIAGFYGGWFSHLFSDMLSSDGVRLFCWLKTFKLRLVPKRANLTVNLIISSSIGLISLMCYLLSINYDIKYSLISIAGMIISIVLIITSLNIGNMKFNTGLSSGNSKDKNSRTWEDIVYTFTLKVNAVIFILSLCYPYIKTVM